MTVGCSDGKQPVEDLKTRLLFFCSTDAVLLSFFFSGLCSMVGSGRMPLGLSVMYEFVSFSVCAVLWKLTSVIKVSESK